MSTTERPVGLSVWEQALYDVLVGHITNEGELLGEYDDLAARSSGHVRYLIDMIGDDEARHHALFRRWANSLRALPLEAEGDDVLPPVHAEEDPERVADAADRLLDIERADQRELRKLRKELDDFEDTTLWALVVELMQLDTEKHIRILEFLRRHARETLKAR
jgi:rubrerythrin